MLIVLGHELILFNQRPDRCRRVVPIYEARGSDHISVQSCPGASDRWD